MNDNNKEEIKENKPEEAKPIQIVITLETDGQIKVQAPFQNGILCYGLLELAKEVVFDMRHKEEKNKIQPARHGILDFVRRR